MTSPYTNIERLKRNQSIAIALQRCCAAVKRNDVARPKMLLAAWHVIEPPMPKEWVNEEIDLYARSGMNVNHVVTTTLASHRPNC